jgi:hypothetical protein
MSGCDVKAAEDSCELRPLIRLPATLERL